MPRRQVDDWEKNQRDLKATLKEIEKFERRESRLPISAARKKELDKLRQQEYRKNADEEWRKKKAENQRRFRDKLRSKGVDPNKISNAIQKAKRLADKIEQIPANCICKLCGEKKPRIRQWQLFRGVMICRSCVYKIKNNLLILKE